jgi:hypothetical protein
MSRIDSSSDIRTKDTDFINWGMDIFLVRPFGIDHFSIIREISGKVLLLWLLLAPISHF